MNKLPDIQTDFSGWYQEVLYRAQLVDQSPVRGCMVIMPYGNNIWEQIKGLLDQKIKKTGHKNVIFPLLIPESFLKREAAHIKGFAPECAVVTHAGGKKLAEPLVVRPTSETMVHYMFAKWISSWRDLPLKINQWANVLRWEMRPRAFLRTSEFFWQEGHTAHATAYEADDEAKMMLKEYIDLVQNELAIPILTGLKSESEKFPGAEKTYTFETIMRDGKALQLGTSHLLLQSFAHSFDITYQDKQGVMQYPHLTSWGTTTRLIGAVVMIHGDKKGLIIPPRIAPIQVVIVPIYKTDKERKDVALTAQKVYAMFDCKVRVYYDDNDQERPGSKFHTWELKGVPLRIEIGPCDVKKNEVVVVQRISGDKKTVPIQDLVPFIIKALEDAQTDLFVKAQKRLCDMKKMVKTLDEIIKCVDQGSAYFQTGWCGDLSCEKKLIPHTLSIRCLLKEKNNEICLSCGKKSSQDVIIARSY